MFQERRQIVELWKRGEAVALITLTRVEGSSYRRPGARLLLGRNGSYAGAISGGCLEAELLRKAEWMVRGGATLQRYSTLFDDTADIPYGLGCGGTVDLLLEPANTVEFTELMQALEASLDGQARRVMTYLPDGGGLPSRSILDGQGLSLFQSASLQGSLGFPVFEEWVEAPQRLFVFGAGDDAQPLVRMAALLGWRVVVADGRTQWARPERFPAVDGVSTAEPGPEAVAKLGVEPADLVVVMTHSYEQDRAWLTALLPVQPRYIGLLGARHRSALLLSEAAQALRWSLDRACDRIFAPVGLDLGGDGAEAIALAIVAEMQACVEGRLAAPRRMTPALIAEQIAEGGASRYLQTQCAL